ncbi:hypothetical protein FGG08_005974 [Glutinoglossum americanum]|uniref:Phenylalanine ammonia-lyase n=1 Tax=Glutinoglossum americanum TaxID=1670608 RepID=A0A9P8HZ89_9PEZI|nr:hypothetical protein FGG08_005974 [Glutinoglossum americanum]
MSGRSHGELVFSDWLRFQNVVTHNDGISLDGNSLDVPSVVAISRYGALASVDKCPLVVGRIRGSVEFLQEELKKDHSIYGINTGFGGSADTRTQSLRALQTALIQMQISAVLPPNKTQAPGEVTAIYGRALPNNDVMAALSMPEAWVRGAMLVRSNSLIRGHSAVRLFIIENIVKLLQNDCVPLVPLRGSISASGDLCPLSYIAGALEGNPDVRVWTGDRKSRRLAPANEVLTQLGMQPVSFGPKEGLGVLNGTAVSAAVAALALHEANHLAVLTQVLTAIGVEALSGTTASFDPFIAKVRPHPGQTEVALNISSFLEGSKLARADDTRSDGQLRQDRYALRTSSQWLGPYLEDLLLAHSQLSHELNSTTDNPLIDAQAQKIHHGGNFQAVSITSSTEKTRLALQMMGKLLFAQSSELLDVRLNNGLPPNLSADEPSLSYTLKGVDINMAAYMAELALLANPASSHVQNSEMGNQSVNSLALVSTRYTHMAVDVLSLMASAYLYSLCQALDLRVMQAKFLEKLQPAIEEITTEMFSPFIPPTELTALHNSLWPAVGHALQSTATSDSCDRFTKVAMQAHCHLLAFKFRSSSNTDKFPIPYSDLLTWNSRVAKTSHSIFLSARTSYLAHPDATSYLGAASKRIYKFVRQGLNIPFHRGLCDHPAPKCSGGENLANTGSRISVIHEALRTGRLMVPVMECLGESLRDGASHSGAKL